MLFQEMAFDREEMHNQLLPICNELLCNKQILTYSLDIYKFKKRISTSILINRAKGKGHLLIK